MNWSQAFARQAASDLDAREVLLEDKKLSACHSLHSLQMACEKICKSTMIAGGADPMDIQTSHAHIAKQLPKLVQFYLNREGGRKLRGSWIVDAVRKLARKIELLSPAVRDGGRSPENSEYPWRARDGTITAPADHKFEFTALFEPAGILLVKIIRQMAIELQK